MKTEQDTRLLILKNKAMDLGASDVKLISAEKIPLEDGVVEMCGANQCSGYGKSANCPPHVMGLKEARALIGNYEKALFFKIDVAPQLLLSEDRHKIFKKVFLIASRLEILAIEKGFHDAKGLAAGSCKPVFCRGSLCEALLEGAECTYPSLARPSMEAMGINVFTLAKEVGWDIYPILETSDAKNVPKGMLAGLLLIQ